MCQQLVCVGREFSSLMLAESLVVCVSREFKSVSAGRLLVCVNRELTSICQEVKNGISV